MELIEYLNPLLESSDTITRISVFAILSVLMISVVYLVITTFLFRSFFTKQVSDVLQSKKLRYLISDYESSLVEINGERRSFRRFVDKVSRSALLNRFYNDKVLNSISSTLVGLGILGTFLGLSKGVSGFVMDSTDTIKESIGSLLQGMGTAFISSIYGMLSSLIFVLIYQFVRHAVAKRTDRFYAEVDKQFLITEIEHEAHQQISLEKTIRSVIQEYFVEEEEGKLLTPKYYYRELLLNAKNQTSSLSTFADDLAGVLEDIIDKMLEINSKKFRQIIEEQLVPIIEQLRKEKEESASGALEGVLTTLETAMKDMLTEFKESISGETKNEMENLASSLGSITKALGDMPSNIGNLSNDMTNNMSQLVESINAAVKEMHDKQKESEDLRLQNQNEASSKLDNILNNVGTNVESLINQQSASSEKLVEVLKVIDDIVIRNDKSISAFKDLLDSSKGTINDLQVTSQALSEASQSLSTGAKSLESNNGELKDAVSGFVEANNDSIERIRRLQSEVLDKSQKFLSQFEKLEEGIEKVFVGFNDGLEAYSDQLNAELSKSIGNYADSSKIAIEAINGLARDISESVAELAEVNSKSN